MATIAKTALKCVRTLHGGPPVEESYPEAASQTFKKGEAVYLNASGHVAEFTEAIDDDTQKFLGFAAEDGHNSSTAATYNVSVWNASVATGNVFEANICGTAGADQVSALTQVGGLYPIYHDATNGLSLVNIADTAGNEDTANILKINGVVGDTNNRVEFTCLGNITQTHRTS